MAKEESDDIAAALLAKTEELKSAPVGDSSGIGAVRKYLASIEELLKAPGATYATVVTVLRSKGIPMTEKTFATNLTKVRQEQPGYEPRRKTAPVPRSPGRPGTARTPPVVQPPKTAPAITPAPVSQSATPDTNAPVQPERKNVNREL